MERVAVIDLGSNSARLIIMHIYQNNSYNLVYHQKENIRLAEGMFNTGKIQPEAIARAVAAMKMFARMCHIFMADTTIAVATAAIRNAVNGQDVLDCVAENSGIHMMTLSGRDEARTGSMGVINTIDICDCLIFDLGGGSTELTLVKDRQIKKTVSLPFGAVNLTDRFSTSHEVSNATLAELNQYLSRQIAGIAWAGKTGLPIVGVGGTARNIAKMDQKRKGYPFHKVHNYRLSNMAFRELWKSVCTSNFKDRSRIAGLSADRQDLIVAGMAVVNALLDHTAAPSLVTSGCGLREGLFMEYLLKRLGEAPVIPDILEHSTRNMALFYKANPKHSFRVTTFSLELFDALQDFHQLDERARQLLNCAASLHDIGITINYYDHSRHSAYLIENARLFGLTHREQMLCALVGGWHHGLKQKLMRLRSFMELLDERDMLIARRLALLLALAEAADATELGLVQSLKTEIQGSELILHLMSKDDDLSLEERSLVELSKPFKKEYGLILKIKRR